MTFSKSVVFGGIGPSIESPDLNFTFTGETGEPQELGILQVLGSIPFNSQIATRQMEMLQRQLDSFTEQINNQIDNQFHADAITVGAVTGVSGAVSVGYVMWAIRGGSLAASLASSLPILRSLDPLPVLEHWEKNSANQQGNSKAKPGKEDEDEQKIQSLLK